MIPKLCIIVLNAVCSCNTYNSYKSISIGDDCGGENVLSTVFQKTNSIYLTTYVTGLESLTFSKIDQILLKLSRFPRNIVRIVVSLEGKRLENAHANFILMNLRVFVVHCEFQRNLLHTGTVHPYGMRLVRFDDNPESILCSPVK